MNQRAFRLNSGLLTIGVLGASIALATFGCSDDKPTAPEPEVPGPEYSTIETWMGTGINGQGIDGPIETVDLSLVQDLTYGPDGRMYVCDWNNHRVRVVSDGVSQTLIGTGELGDALDGPANEIKLNHPTHVSFDPVDGRLILSAWHNSKVMELDLATGQIEAICGNGQRSYGGDDGPAIEAILDLPSCSVFDEEGNLWISDLANQSVRVIDRNGVIRTAIGKEHTAGFAGDGGPAIDARIWLPIGQSAPPVGRACFDADGNYYIADTVNNRIRRVDPSGIIDTVAGSGRRGYDGDGGPATEARMAWPADVAIGPNGDLFIADTRNSVIRRVDRATGIISTFAGVAGENGYNGDGKPPEESWLDRPYGIEFDGSGNLYIADTHSHRIRIIRK